MTLGEFFAAVETLKERWRVRQNGEIRTFDAPHRSLLGAVCAHRTGQEYQPGEWRRATEALGLTLQDGEPIHQASEMILPYNRDMRLQILDIIGVRQRRNAKPGPFSKVSSKPAPVRRGARTHGNSQRNAAPVLDDETDFD